MAQRNYFVDHFSIYRCDRARACEAQRIANISQHAARSFMGNHPYVLATQTTCLISTSHVMRRCAFVAGGLQSSLDSARLAKPQKPFVLFSARLSAFPFCISATSRSTHFLSFPKPRQHAAHSFFLPSQPSIL